MDAFSTEVDVSYSDAPPVLITGSSEAAIDRARQTVIGAGLRIGAALKLPDAVARLQQQARASAVWVELDEVSPNETAHDLIRILNADVRGGRYSAVVSASKQLIDPLAAALDDEVQLVIDPNPAERVSALAIALASRGVSDVIADVAADRSAERLRQLGEEVSRIASTLARLSTGPAVVPQPAALPRTADAPAVSAEVVRSVIRARRVRARHFSEELFGDPAWDMLLDLLQAEISHLRVPVSSLCIAAAVPATTALRWLKTMVSQGLFVRRADLHDGRRVFVELSPEASRAMRNYFAEVGQVPSI